MEEPTHDASSQERTMSENRTSHDALVSLTSFPENERAQQSSLPLQLTSFIGREREVATVTERLGRSDVRLLTLTGPGGVGKTRLALRVADEAARAFADTVAFVPLAPIRDPDLVLPTVSHVLGVPDATGPFVLKRLMAFLSDKQLLLVLDNIEHLLSAGPTVVDMLKACPGLKVLCTSRIRLGVSGEHVFTVPPFTVTDVDQMPPIDQALEEAVQLFVQRATASASGFVLTPQNVQDVREVCRRLDGLPLAIELAAARVNVLSPRALLHHLEHRLDLLTDGPRDASPRHQDMRETIGWSYNLLPESNQSLIRRLAVFNGGWFLEAAQTVVGEDTNILNGLSTLVAASLVIPTDDIGGEPRFTMLETIGEYAREQLAVSGDEASVQQAHALHYVALAEQMWNASYGLETEDWMRRLRPEISNIRLALEWTLGHEPIEAVRLVGALDEYWIRFGYITEGRDWVVRALAASNSAPAFSRARALLIAGWLALEQDDLIQAEVHLTEALTLAKALTDHGLLAYGFALLGGVALKDGDFDRARQLHEQERAHAASSGQPLLVAIALLNLGRVTLATNNLSQAQDFLEHALSIHRSVLGSFGVVVAQYFLGQVMLGRREYTSAVTHFHEAFHGFEKAGDVVSAARSLEGLAGSVVTTRPDSAIKFLSVATVLRERVGHPPDRADRCISERAVAAARIALGEQAFSAAWEAGRQIAWDDLPAEINALVDTLAISPPLSQGETQHGLSPREQEVLQLMVEGSSNRTIADLLSVSERTAESHVSHILHKLNLESRTAAMAFAVRHGLV